MPWMIPAAILASTVVSAGVGLSAASSAKNASQQATDAATAQQNAALATQQANSAPYRAAGAAALDKLGSKFGLSTQAAAESANAGPGAGAPSRAGQPNWDQYLSNDPGLIQQYNSLSDGYKQQLGVSTPQEFAQWHYNTTGKNEPGRELPTYQADPVAPTPTAAVPATIDPSAPQPITGQGSLDESGFYTADRPAVGAAPVYTAPALTNAPGYAAPNFRETQIAPLDTSIDSYQRSPDYNFQQEQGNKNILTAGAAAGSLQSGAALKALQKFGQDLAQGDYSQWRDYQTGQYNTNRADTRAQDAAANSFGVNNAQFGANLANNQWQYGNTYNQSNALAKFGADQGNYQYGTNLGQNIYTSNRDYTTNQNNSNSNVLLSLAQMGSGQTTANNSAIGANANNVSAGLTNNAINSGNASLATGGLINNAVGNGVNALAYYYGNQPGTTGAAGSPLGYDASADMAGGY